MHRTISGIKLILLIISFLQINSNIFSQETDSTANVLVRYRIQDNSRNDTIPADTLLDMFHIYKTFDKRSISESNLGNYGSAIMSNLYTSNYNLYTKDFYFSNPFDLYLLVPENDIYFDTRRPYTDIQYFGSQKVKDEQSLYFVHSQNFGNKINFTLKYNLISSKGIYPNQKTKNHSLSGQFAYNGQKYSVNTSLQNNKFTLQDNGGIIDTGTVDINALESYLSNAQTVIFVRNVNLNQKFKIGKRIKEEINDTVVEVFRTKFSIIHSLNYNRNYRTYEDAENTGSEYYNNFYYTSVNEKLTTYDSIYFRNFNNTIGLISEEAFLKKNKFGFDILLGNELKKYYNFKEYIVLNNEEYFSDNSLKFNLFTDNSKKFVFNAKSSYYFSGYRSGDLNLKTGITQKFGNNDSTIVLNFNFNLLQNEVDYFITNYYSNHYKWNNNFDKVSDLILDANFEAKRFKFKFGGNASYISNYVYFGADTLPKQTDEKLKLYSAFLQKDLSFGIFRMSNKLVWQQSSNKDILSIPGLSLYHCTYIDVAWKLQFQIGVDAYFTTKYTMNSFNPAVGAFYFDNTETTGMYPVIGAFASGKIKGNVLFFLKFEHLNSGFIQDLYYTVNNYPIFERMFKFGVRWTFTN